MAIAPLNEFKSKFIDLTNLEQEILEVPISVATIVLDARAINITGIDPNLDPYVARLTVRVVKESGNDVLLVPDMEIPPNDSLEFISGKFVMEEGDTLYAKADDMNRLQLAISYLETSA